MIANKLVLEGELLMNYLNKNKNKYYVIKKNSTLVLLNKDNELIGSYGALNDTVFHKSQVHSNINV